MESNNALVHYLEKADELDTSILNVMSAEWKCGFSSTNILLYLLITKWDQSRHVIHVEMPVHDPSCAQVAFVLERPIKHFSTQLKAIGLKSTELFLMGTVLRHYIRGLTLRNERIKLSSSAL